MANSLKFYSDSGLTTEFTGNLIASQNVDGSTGDVDFQLWLGSTNASHKFEASSNPGVDTITLDIVNATAVWAASTAYSLTDEVRTSAQLGYYFECTTAGTSAGVEPTWTNAPNVDDTIVDGGVTWTNRGPFHEATEVKLATSSGNLGAAVPGQSLGLGVEILGGSVNAQEVWVRVNDATEVIGTSTELSVATVETDEVDV